MDPRYDYLRYPYSFNIQSQSKKWENRVTAPNMKIANYRQGNNIRHFHFIAEQIEHNILSDLTIEGLGYNGVTPGPVIIMRQGEWIYLTVENRLDETTALHVHGLAKPNSQDGVPDITPSTPF